MRSIVFLVGLVCLSAFSLQATPVAVNFVFAEQPPNSTHVALPFLMNATNDELFLKFKIPDIALIETINSFDINVTVYDDGDVAGETGRILFALPGPNLPLTGFSLQDGSFRIRVVRDSGDFFVGGGTAFIDATLVPEPASLLGVFSGLLMIGVWLRGRLPEAARHRDSQ
jgi:hypothetical protein